MISLLVTILLVLLFVSSLAFCLLYGLLWLSYKVYKIIQYEKING